MMRKARIQYEECGAPATVVLNGSKVAYCDEHAKAYCEAEGIIIAEEKEDANERPATM